MVTGLGNYGFSESTLEWVWGHFKAIHKRGEPPRNETLIGLLCCEAEAAQEPLKEALKDISSTRPSASPQSDCDTLRKLFAQDQLALGMDRAGKSLAVGDMDGAKEQLSKLVRETSTGSGGVKALDLIDWADWFSVPTSVEGIPTGIKRLDEELMGGISKQEMGIIFGNTNMGKSIMCNNFGYAAFKHQFKVLHIDSENGADTVRCRYVARMTNQPTKALQRRRLQSTDWMLSWARKNKDRLDGILRIMPIGVGQTTRQEVEESVDTIIASGFKPDLVLFDSVDHIAIEEADNIALQMKRLYEWCKGWFQKLDVAGWVVTQAGKESEGKIATNRNMAWGYDKGRIADINLSINPPLDEKGRTLPEHKMGSGRSMYVAKCRSGDSRFMLKLKTDFPVASIQQDLDEQDAVQPASTDEKPMEQAE